MRYQDRKSSLIGGREQQFFSMPQSNDNNQCLFSVYRYGHDRMRQSIFSYPYVETARENNRLHITSAIVKFETSLYVSFQSLECAIYKCAKLLRAHFYAHPICWKIYSPVLSPNTGFSIEI